MTAALWAGLAVTAAAVNRWAVLTDDGGRMGAALEFSADGSSVTLRQENGAASSIPLRMVASILHRGTAAPIRPPVLPPAHYFFAELPSGARMLAESLEMTGGTLILGNSLWGRHEFAVTSVWRIVASDSMLPPPPPNFTGIRYANGDTVPGTPVSMAGDTILVDMPGIGKMPVTDWGAVSEVVFRSGVSRPTSSAGVEVFLRSGEILLGSLAGGSNWFLKVKTDWSADPLTVPLEALSGIVFHDGRTLLSSAVPRSETASSFLGYQHPTVRDRALTGGMLSVDAYAASRGLAMYAGNRVDFALPPATGGATLLAWAGVDDAIPPRMGMVELRILVDGQMAASARLESGETLAPIRVETPASASTLSILTESGPRGPAGSHLDVIHPSLRIKPAAATPPPQPAPAP